MPPQLDEYLDEHFPNLQKKDYNIFLAWVLKVDPNGSYVNQFSQEKHKEIFPHRNTESGVLKETLVDQGLSLGELEIAWKEVQLLLLEHSELDPIEKMLFLVNWVESFGSNRTETEEGDLLILRSNGLEARYSYDSVMGLWELEINTQPLTTVYVAKTLYQLHRLATT